MTALADTTTWLDANRRYLMAAVAVVRAAIQRLSDGSDQSDEALGNLRAASDLLPDPSALDGLSAAFGLSPFERNLLVLCAGVELDPGFAAVCASAQANLAATYATFGLGMAALPEPHWSAIAPEASLRRWRMIEVGPGNAIATSPLRIDERILHHLLGVEYRDERLAGFVEPVTAGDDLSPSQMHLAEKIAHLQGCGAPGRFPVVQLCGLDRAGLRAIACASARQSGASLWALQAAVIPSDARECAALVRLWERESVLSHGTLLLECGDHDSGDPAHTGAIERFMDVLNAPLMVSTPARLSIAHRQTVVFDIEQPTSREQLDVWQRTLGKAAGRLDGRLESIVSQFSLSGSAIRAAGAQALAQHGSRDLAGRIWAACRAEARPEIDHLAQRVPPMAGWEDLVLPDAQRDTLQSIVTHVRQRATVYERWGFARKSGRGLGISVLFAGPSGTGKTMAGEVLANELDLDLYRIDLSQVISKYIGETEKNLRRVFDAAEQGGAILFFDEADALFGKRSEVKDSHDRYANIEVSYLLQRMEAYRGLAILTTNMKTALDPAFLRRIRFVVSFPFPETAQRAEIWRGVFPAQTPTEGLDIDRLAQLNVAGGSIRNTAMAAAFAAADAGEPVRMAHLLRAARAECAKLERPLSDREVAGWV